jgi:hypothetical protein
MLNRLKRRYSDLRLGYTYVGFMIANPYYEHDYNREKKFGITFAIYGYWIKKELNH